MIAVDDAAWAGPWRRIRVGEKVTLGLGLVLTAAVAPPWPAAPLVALAAVVLTLGPARIPLRVLALGVAGPLSFLALGALSVAVRLGPAHPEAWFVVGPLSADASTVLAGASLFARSTAGTLAVLLLATTTPMVDLLGWARRRGVPGPLVEVASLMYRLLFVLLDTVTGVRAAQVARLGDAPDGRRGLMWRWNMAAGAMGSVLVRAWDRAARLTDGLAARGIDGDLVMLAPRQPASPGFVIGSVVLLSGIWVSVALWTVFA